MNHDDPDRVPIMRAIRDHQGPLSWEDLKKEVELDEEALEDALRSLMDAGVVFEPVLGAFLLTDHAVDNFEEFVEIYEERRVGR